MKNLIPLLILLLSITTSAWEEFPADSPDLKPLARAVETIYTDSGEVHFYAVLSSNKDQSFLDVYKGLPWKRLHRWPISFEGEKVKVRDRVVLKMSHDGDEKVIHFYWTDYVGYAEAAVHQVLLYDRKSGKFTTSWSD